MKRLLRLALVFVVGVIVLGHQPGAWACSCVGGITDEQYFRDAEAVFAGAAVTREDPNASSPTQSSGDPIAWTFDVDSVQKGRVDDPQKVTTARDGATCGYAFEAGTRYQVFAGREADGTLSTGICSGTRVLAAGQAPFGGRLAVTGQAPPIAAAMILMVAAASLALAARRRA